MMYPGHLWPTELDQGGRRALRRLIESRGLRLVTLNMPNIDLNVAGASAEMRAYSLGLLSSFVELGGDLGAEGMVVGPGKANPLFPMPREQLIGHFRAALDHLSPIAERAGVGLWVENMPFAFLPDAESLMTVLADHGDDRIGITYDVANAVFIREDPAEGLKRVKDRLRVVHLSDTPLEVYRHDPVGTGVVPFEIVPPVLAEIGHREPAMLEVISRDPDADIMDSCRRLLARGWGRAAGAGD
jgi:L-ribulose-5-phosphate 3-epimerase